MLLFAGSHDANFVVFVYSLCSLLSIFALNISFLLGNSAAVVETSKFVVDSCDIISLRLLLLASEH